MFRVRRKWRSVGKYIAFRRVAMKIYEYFQLLLLLFSLPLEVLNDSHQLGEKLFFSRLLVNIPVTVKVMSQNSSSIVSNLHSIQIYHWNYYPRNLSFKLVEAIDETLHHPATHTLTWVLPCKNHYYCLCIFLVINDYGINFMAKDSFRNFNFFESQIV